MEKTTIQQLAKEIHQIAVEKGFWEGQRSDKQIAMLIISELSEAMEADRKGRRAQLERLQRTLKNSRIYNRDETYKGEITPEQSFSVHFELLIKDTFEDEIADTFIRVLDWSESKGYVYEEIRKTVFIHPDKPDALFDLVDTVVKNCGEEELVFYDKESKELNMNLLIDEIIAFALHYKIDLETHVRLKMEYNRSRPYKHGKKY